MESVLSAVIFLPFLFSHFFLGFHAGAVQFTRGTREFNAAAGIELTLILAAFIGSMIAVEIIFRGLGLRRLLAKYSLKKAVWIHMALLNLFLLPYFAVLGTSSGQIGFFRFMIQENFWQGFLTLFFLRCGNPWLTGILHGWYNFARFQLLGDVTGPFETFYFYAAAADDFYWLMIAAAAWCLGAQLIINRIFGTQEKAVCPVKR